LTLDEKILRYEKHYRKTRAYNYALSLINFDGDTEGPKDAYEDRAEVLGTLSLEYFKHTTSQEYEQIINDLEEDYENLDEKMQRIVKLCRKNLSLLKKIPPKEYEDFSILVSKSNHVWKDAKEKGDFSIFEPYLEQVVEYQRKFAKYYGEIDGFIYNSLLDQYEEGATIAKLDKFFAVLKERIVPLLQKINSSKVVIRDAFLERECPKDKQLELGRYVAELLGFNPNHGMIKETEHPFTIGISKNDIRFTTHVYENNILSNLYSCAHEAGHAIYGQNINRDLINSILGDGASMAFHESQSRFFENIIGRSEPFISIIFSKIQELFPTQFSDVSEREFYLAANIVKPSFIRTEADELTYCLHVMLRYELEKQLIGGEIEVKDLPELWNKKMEEYLGVIPPNDRVGVLQDVHWSQGSIGYFFSYALGNAYSAQIYKAMKKDLDVDKIILSKDLSLIREWLYDHVYKYGALYPPEKLIKIATGEEFNPNYYCDYLEEKFSKIYKLKFMKLSSFFNKLFSK